MVRLLFLFLICSWPLTSGQMFNSLAEMLNPQLLNAVFRNIGPLGGGQSVNIGTENNFGGNIGGQSVNIGTDDNFGTNIGGQAVNIGNDGNTDMSLDDSTVNFGLPPTAGGVGFPQPVGGLFPMGGPILPPAGRTNQNFGQITQNGVGNTINVASSSRPGQIDNLTAGQVTQQGIGNSINVGQSQSQPQQGFPLPSTRNIRVGQLRQQGVGNSVNFGQPQQSQTGLIPGQNTATNPSAFGAQSPGTQNRFQRQRRPPRFQRPPNQFPPMPNQFPPMQSPFAPFGPNVTPFGPIFGPPPIPIFGGFPPFGMGFM